MNADALSRCPQVTAPMCGIAQDEIQVTVVSTETDVSNLLKKGPVSPAGEQWEHYGAKQQKDQGLKEMNEGGVLQNNLLRAKKLSAQELPGTTVFHVGWYVLLC